MKIKMKEEGLKFFFFREAFILFYFIFWGRVEVNELNLNKVKQYNLRRYKEE